MCESVASDDWVLNHEAIACSSHTYSVVWSPHIAKMAAMNQVPEVACVCWRVRAGAFLCGHVGASNNAFDRPGGWFSG